MAGGWVPWLAWLWLELEKRSKLVRGSVQFGGELSAWLAWVGVPCDVMGQNYCGMNYAWKRDSINSCQHPERQAE